MIEVFQIPALKDNYIHVLKSSSGQVAVVDPSESGPVNQFLKNRKWPLHFILNTHHHFDHVGGNLELKKMWNCSVAGFHKDAHRIPGIDICLEENEVWQWGEHSCRILFIPGHTLGHIALWFAGEKLLFCGDTLFGMGCGRLFEGSPGQMFSSLKKLSNLPQDTLIYCGHEYTYQNGLFALEVERGNLDLQKRVKVVERKRKENLSTLPFTLLEELKTNPFLRCEEILENRSATHPHLQKWMNKHDSISALDLFIQIRKLKDQF